MQNHSQFTPYQQILAERQGRGVSEAEVTEILRQVLLQLIQWHDQGQAYGFISLETIAQNQISNQVVLLQGSQFVSGYLAPEVSQSGQISPSGDIYALGVAIAVLLTGQPPETLRNFDGTWNWSDRCVVSDQFEQILNLALTDHATHRYVNARQMLAALFPNLQVPVSRSSEPPTTVIMNPALSSSPKPASFGLAVGVGITILCGILGFGVSKLIAPQNNVTNSVINTPEALSPVSISPTVTVTATPSPTSISQSPSSPPTPTNPFENSRFPQAACGDPMPNDNGSTISLYPVFVEYSDSNLQQIKAQFCQDALPKIRKDTNRQAVQVASFTSRDRAVLFTDFLSKRIKGASVGEPTILPSSRSSNSIAAVISNDRVSFANGASYAIVSSNVSSSQKRQYVLNCGSGQQFNASLVQGQANLRLIDPNGATVTSGSNNLSARLAVSGDYTIEVSAFEPANFNLRIEVL